MLVSVTEVSPREPGTGAVTPDEHFDLIWPTLDGTVAPQGQAAIHCGSPMQLVTPASGWQGTSYTFAPAGAGLAALPPVWRCACGFQLDAWATDDCADHNSAAPSFAFPA
ncbi:hypothetical protein HNO81_04900 [Pseudarthrobacter sp. C4D7]|nr:hypothetical protein [Pseudarthrobacter sp. C4D7]